MAVGFTTGDLITMRIAYAVGDREERAFNILHYRIGAVVGAPSSIFVGLSVAAEAVFTLWTDAWKLFASEDVTCVGVMATSVYPLPRSVSVVFNGAPPVDGTIVSDTLPLQDAVTILKKTSLGGRKGYGRVFVPGIPESAAEEGRITAGGEGTLANLIDAVKANVNVVGAGWNFILEPTLLGGPEDNPVRMTPVEDAMLSDVIIKTQRRRRPGKGS